MQPNRIVKSGLLTLNDEARALYDSDSQLLRLHAQLSYADWKRLMEALNLEAQGRLTREYILQDARERTEEFFRDLENSSRIRSIQFDFIEEVAP